MIDSCSFSYGLNSDFFQKEPHHWTPIYEKDTRQSVPTTNSLQNSQKTKVRKATKLDIEKLSIIYFSGPLAT